MRVELINVIGERPQFMKTAIALCTFLLPNFAGHKSCEDTLEEISNPLWLLENLNKHWTLNAENLALARINRTQ
jgi:hypothetical protein